MSKLTELLIENPVIAALKSENDLDNIITSNAQIIFVLYGNILTLPDVCTKLNNAGKTVFIHMDLIEGLKSDISGIEFLKKYANPAGIISTKINVIKYAKQNNLQTILRIFLIDSLSLKTGIKNINETNPNAVELMPGVATKVIHKMRKQTNVPIIAGGLIEDKKDIMDALAAGAVAISTTSTELWEI